MRTETGPVRNREVSLELCTSSFAVTVKDLSDGTGASDYQGVSVTEHCAELVDDATNDNEWYQSSIPYSADSRVADTTIVAAVTDCRMMQTASMSVLSTSIPGESGDDNCTIGDQSYGKEHVPTSRHSYDDGYIFKPGSDPIANNEAMERPKVQYYGGDPATDRFQILGARPPLNNETVHKVGRTTGWTSGRVDFMLAQGTGGMDPTCTGGRLGFADNGRPSTGDGYIECESYAEFGAAGGDSGSPVFARFSGTDYVHLVGVLYAQVRDQGIFIPIDRIYAESLRQGYDWEPSWLRPIPAPSDIDGMAISSGGTNTITIKATFDKKLFSPSLYYRAK